jgi:hypothetical protein
VPATPGRHRSIHRAHFRRLAPWPPRTAADVGRMAQAARAVDRGSARRNARDAV